MDLTNIENLNNIHANIQQAGENMNFGMNDEEEVKERKTNKKNNGIIGEVESVHSSSAEADSAAGSKSVNSGLEKKFNEEQDMRYKNPVQEPKSFLDSLWNKKGSSLHTTVGACNDIKFLLETASLEEGEKMKPL